MSQFFTLFYWKNINHLFTIWVYSFGAIPFIYLYFQFVAAKKVEESVLKRSTKASFVFNLIFVPAILFVIYVLAKITEHSGSLSF